jgi:hypothetical protein
MGERGGWGGSRKRGVHFAKRRLWTDSEFVRRGERQTGRQAGRQTDRQASRQAGRQAGKDRQTDRPRHTESKGVRGAGGAGGSGAGWQIWAKVAAGSLVGSVGSALCHPTHLVMARMQVSAAFDTQSSQSGGHRGAVLPEANRGEGDFSLFSILATEAGQGAGELGRSEHSRLQLDWLDVCKRSPQSRWPPWADASVVKSIQTRNPPLSFVIPPPPHNSHHQMSSSTIFLPPILSMAPILPSSEVPLSIPPFLSHLFLSSSLPSSLPSTPSTSTNPPPSIHRPSGGDRPNGVGRCPTLTNLSSHKRRGTSTGMNLVRALGGFSR